MNAQILITVVAGLFILPFFIFSATAGQLADKYEKSFLIHIIKFVEIVLMLLTAAAFMYQSLWLLIILLFFMGAQSTFFGPLKFSILPQHLREDELVAGNGFVSAGTYIAILTGTLCGGLFILRDLGRSYISCGVVGVAVLGYAASLCIPKAPPAAPDMTIDWNVPRSTWRIMADVLPDKVIFRAILGISWFWFLGAVLLAQFPSFSKDVVGGNEQVSTLFLVIFSIGVGLGSTLCNKLLNGRVSGRLVPASCLGMSAGIALLYAVSFAVSKGTALVGVKAFLAAPASWGVVAAFLMLAVFGGVFSVPMYAIMQAQSSDDHRARVVACLNIMNSLFMVLSAVFCYVLLMLKFSITGIFLAVGVVNLLITPLLAKLAGGINNG